MPVALATSAAASPVAFGGGRAGGFGFQLDFFALASVSTQYPLPHRRALHHRLQLALFAQDFLLQLDLLCFSTMLTCTSSALTSCRS